MISLILYGRNDNYGYNLHKRAALSLNCMAEILRDDDEILFVDYNTPDDYPTFPEAIVDTLTDTARRRLRIFRVRARHHARFRDRTHLVALEPVARNVAVRRSNPANRWILSTNTDMIFVPHRKELLTDIIQDLPDGFYHLPRFEIPESLWETLDRRDPQRILTELRMWGRAAHLHEIVYVAPEIKYDGPGDFQLILRSDLLRIHGFHEQMLRGWHVDANMAKRLYLLYGCVSDVVDRLFGYHCDHTRQVTPAHRHNAVQNDARTFFEQVTLPEIPEQMQNWGLIDEDIEEISLRESQSVFLKALQVAITTPMLAPSKVHYQPDSFDSITYDPRHVMPFLLDLLSNYPRDIHIGWYGGHAQLLTMFATARHTIGCSGAILLDSQVNRDHLVRAPGVALAAPGDLVRRADVFVFDFWAPAPEQTSTHDREPEPEVTLLPPRHVLSGFRAAIAAERLRLQHAASVPRRFVLINAIHNRFEILANAYIEAARTPFSTRIRQGFLLPEAESLAKVRLSNMSVGAAGIRDGDCIRTRDGVADYVVFGPYVDLPPGHYRFALTTSTPPADLEGNSHEPVLVIDIVSGAYIAAYQVLSRADLRTESHAYDFTIPDDFCDWHSIGCFEFRVWANGGIRTAMTSVTLTHLEDAECLADDAGDFDWLPLMQVGLAGMRSQALLGPVETRPGEADYMIYGPYCNLLPGSYRLLCEIEVDATDETCALALQASQPGLEFIIVSTGERSLARLPAVLQPGRHTYEVLFSRPCNDAKLARPIDATRVEFRILSHGIIPFQVHTMRLVRFSRDILYKSLITLLLGMMRLGPAGLRSGASILARQDVPGLVMFGPYLDLPPGRYCVTVAMTAECDTTDSQSELPTITIEAVCGPYIAARCTLSAGELRQGAPRLIFSVPEDLKDYGNTQQFEFRLWTSGGMDLTIAAITLDSADDLSAADSNDFDWLPLLHVGPAGVRSDATGAWVSGRPGSVGHIVYGPYVDLLPGNYRLCFEIAADGNSPALGTQTPAGEAPLELEVVAQDIVLSRAPINPRSGVHVYEVPFALAREVAKKLPGGALEFRLQYSGTLPLALRALRLQRGE